MQCTTETASASLKYHVENQIPLTENIFRYGSIAWGSLIREARALYQSGEIHELDFDEYQMLESSVAELAEFHGRVVMLEVPETNWERDGWTFVFIEEDGVVKRVDLNLVTEESFVTI